MTPSHFACLGVFIWLVTTCLPAPGDAAGRKIIAGGAQSLVPLAEKFSAQFHRSHPDVEIEIRRANSNYAVSAVRNGDFSIGLITRPLSASEKSEFHVQDLGHDAIVLLSYSWNSVADLTVQQLQQIYLGKITNWKEMGGEDKGIVPLTREATSALHRTFIEILFGKGFTGKERAFVLRASKEKVLRTIKRIRGSVGYGIVRMEEAENEGVKVLSINGKMPSTANIQQNLYPLTRPLSVISKDNPDAVVQDWVSAFARFTQQSHNEGNR
jgi:phosphate transport system substrate-binding protein